MDLEIKNASGKCLGILMKNCHLEDLEEDERITLRFNLEKYVYVINIESGCNRSRITLNGGV
jgi:hypothetical protein